MLSVLEALKTTAGRLVSKRASLERLLVLGGSQSGTRRRSPGQRSLRMETLDPRVVMAANVLALGGSFDPGTSDNVVPDDTVQAIVSSDSEVDLGGAVQIAANLDTTQIQLEEYGVALEEWNFDVDSEGLGETSNYTGVWEFNTLDKTVAETSGGALKFKGAPAESANTSVTTHFDQAPTLSPEYSSGVYEFSFDLTAFDLAQGSTSGNGIDFGLMNSDGTNLLTLAVAEDGGNIQLEATHGALPGTGVTTTNVILSQSNLVSTPGVFSPVTITAMVDLDLDIFNIYVLSENGDVVSSSSTLPFGFDAVQIASISVSSSMHVDGVTNNFIEVDNVNLTWARNLIRGNNPESFLTDRPDFAGVWVNSAGASDAELRENLPGFSHFLAGETARIKWHTLKPSAEEAYDFSEVGDQLQRAADLGYHWSGPLWTGQNAPDYVIEAAGKIQTESVDINGDPVFYPDYYSTSYREAVKDLIENYADYLAGLSEELRERIAILNPGFGSTGDSQLFSGNNILTPNYEHNSEKFFAFMKEITLAWYEAFDRPELSHVRHIWKINSYDGTDTSALETALAKDLTNTTKTRVLGGEMLYGKWMRENFDAQLRAKQFLLAIGPTAVNETNFLSDEELETFFGKTDIWDGNAEYVRGEFNDNKFANTDMGNAAIRAHYYWTALSGVDKGLDGWETKWQWLFGDSTLINYDTAEPDPTEWDHFEFSHRYSFEKNGETSPVAFLAFRDSLDYADTGRFNTDDYGLRRKDSIDRMNAVINEYWDNGAQNDDAEYVRTGGGGNTYLENSTGLNDVVWQVFDDDFKRFIEPIVTFEGPEGSEKKIQQGVGWWRVGWYKDATGATHSTEVDGVVVREMIDDPHPYGRYSRAFEGAENNRMDFKYVDSFLDEGSHDLKIKVTYYDEFDGALDWSLGFDNGESFQTIAANDSSVVVVDKGLADEEFHGGDNWKTLIFTVDGANFEGNGTAEPDFSLINGAGSANDYKFHLIEVVVPSRIPDDGQPIAVNDVFTVAEDGILNQNPAGLLGNDIPGVSGPLAVNATPVAVPQNGIVSLQANGAFIYTPNENFVGNDTFSYEVSDGVTTNIASVTIEVTERLEVDLIQIGGGSLSQSPPIGRSIIDVVRVQFDGLASTDPNAFVVERTDGASVVDVSVDVTLDDSSGSTVAELRFAPEQASVNSFGSLADGTYHLRIDGSKVHDADGVVIEDTINHTDGFFAKFADMDSSGSVGLSDFATFRSAFGSNEGDLSFVDGLDANRDEQIGLADFAAFRAVFGS